MRRALQAIAAAAIAALGACATPSTPPAATSDRPETFADGTTMSALSAGGTVRIGVKTDVPGLGYRPPGAPASQPPEGFEIELARFVAGELRIPEQGIQWVPMDTYDREGALTGNKVDLVIASYTMTDERAAVVGQIGPYYVTGQQIMVRDGSPITGLKDLDGKTVCSVASSESDKALVAHGAITKAYTSYAACVDALLAGDLDAVSTDGAILAGFLEAHPNSLSIVGEPFTTQRYGIGYRHGDIAMCRFLRATILEAYDQGVWKAAFESTLGKSGIVAPIPPRPDDCPTG
ncbi:glutamate ABC transporter substrate-binding protein [Cumulibacter manganitolerans]|uniref:glutamate ABC transporter substrate-binding protein n=1 Tax=Cumulibacter manganitolerans TaxID=1884992 RepID=UPI001294D9F1|nr:glutamate ABC transporter substrate-binding protein [Cumulibacter manganitolerans]